MEISELKASVRQERGKGPARRLRSRGLVPAIFYTPRAESIPLAVSAVDLMNLLKKREEHVFIKLIIADKDKPFDKITQIKEVQIEPVSGKPFHADFYEIAMDHKMHFDIPIHLIGVAVGVAEEGGELLHLKRDLKVSCLPMKLPEYVELNISVLHVGDSLKVADLSLDEDITVIDLSDTAIVTVVAPRIAAEAKEGEEEKQDAAPEVIKQKASDKEES
jgi:large subunit ribosomal protein L25